MKHLFLGNLPKRAGRWAQAVPIVLARAVSGWRFSVHATRLSFNGRATRRLALTAVAGLLLALGTANADSFDSDRARQAVLEGRIVPLGEILRKVEESFSGEILEVQLEDEGNEPEHRGRGKIVYEIKLLTPQGNVLKLQFDARTKELLKIKGRGADAARRNGGQQ